MSAGTVRDVRTKSKSLRATCTERGAKRLRMIHERLRRARIDAGYETAAEAARALGWNVNTYTSSENGTRGLTQQKALDYSRAFGVGLEWLMTGRGIKSRGGRRMIPVVGYVGAGAHLHYDTSGFLEEIEAPPGSHDEDRAARVRGDSQYPRYMDGDLIVFGEAVDPEAAVGRDAVCETEGGAMLVKRVARGPTSGLYTLISHNEPPIHNVRIISAHIIKWVRPA